MGTGFAIARDLLLTCGRIAERLDEGNKLIAVFVEQPEGETLSIRLDEKVAWRGGSDEGVCLVRLRRPLPDTSAILSMGSVQKTFIAGHPDPSATEGDGDALTELESTTVMHRPSLVRAYPGAPVLDQEYRAVGIYLVHGEEPDARPEALPLSAIWWEMEAQVLRSWQRYGGPVSVPSSPVARSPDDGEDEGGELYRALFTSFDPRERGVDEVLFRWPQPDDRLLDPAVTPDDERFVFTFDLAGPDLIAHGPEGARSVRAGGNVVINRCDPHRAGGHVLLYFLGTSADGQPLEFEGDYVVDGRRLMFASAAPGDDLLVAIPGATSRDRPSLPLGLVLHAQTPDGERKTYEAVIINVPRSLNSTSRRPVPC